MYYKILLRVLGFVTERDVETCVGIATRQLGPLPDSTEWNLPLLRSLAKAQLRKSDIGKVVEELIGQVRTYPRRYIVGLSKVRANTLTDNVQSMCKRDLGSDWSVDNKRCMAWLVAFLESETGSPSDGLGKMLAGIQEPPHAYLVPNARAAHELAQGIFQSLKDSPSTALPTGVTFRQQAVESFIKNWIVERGPQGKLIEQLVAEIQAHPYTYLDMPSRTSSSGSVDYASPPA